MNARFRPRKKKVLGLITTGPKKIVRINGNTQIEVSATMSDEEAINRFYMRYNSGQHAPGTYMKPLTPDESFNPEVPMGSMEELGAMVESLESLSETE